MTHLSERSVGPLIGPAYADRGSFRFIGGVAGLEPPVDTDGALSWLELCERPWRLQADGVFAEISALQQDTAGAQSTLRLHLNQKNKRYFPVLESARIEAEGSTPSPSSGVGYTRLHGSDEIRYEADALAISPSGIERHGAREEILSGTAGKSASHYSQFSRLGPYVFMAGVIPIDPERMEPVLGFADVPEEGRFLARGRSHPDSRTGPIAAQAWFCYRRIFDALAAIGITPEDIVLSTVFVTDAADTGDFLRVHEHMFGESRAAVQMICLDEVGHHGSLLEIEVTAVDGLPVRRAGSAGGVAPAAAAGGELLAISDVLGLGDPSPEDSAALTRRGIAAADPHALELLIALRRLEASLAQMGAGWENVGHLWLRLTRPVALEIVEPLISEVAGLWSFAVTVNEVHWIPQAEAAHVGVSALGAIAS